MALAGVPGDDVVVDVFVFPLMWVLWLGGLVATGGGLWAVFARKPKRRAVAPDESEASHV